MNWYYFAITTWVLSILMTTRFVYNIETKKRFPYFAMVVVMSFMSFIAGPFMPIMFLFMEGGDCFSDRGPIKWNFKRIKFRIETV